MRGSVGGGQVGGWDVVVGYEGCVGFGSSGVACWVGGRHVGAHFLALFAEGGGVVAGELCFVVDVAGGCEFAVGGRGLFYRSFALDAIAGGGLVGGCRVCWFLVGLQFGLELFPVARQVGCGESWHDWDYECIVGVVSEDIRKYEIGLSNCIEVNFFGRDSHPRLGARAFSILRAQSVTTRTR